MSHAFSIPRGGHEVQLLQGSGELFPALVEAIDAAQREVRLETYIFDFTGQSVEVAQALERAARRGVIVKVVVDGFGTAPLPPEWQERFVRAGVRWRVYAPLGWLGMLWLGSWRRLHRKLCVVDGAGGLLRRHQHPGRFSRSQPRPAGGAAAGFRGARDRPAGGRGRRHHGAGCGCASRRCATSAGPSSPRRWTRCGRRTPGGCGERGRPPHPANCRGPRHARRWCCATTCATARASSAPTGARSAGRARRSSSPTPTSCRGARCARRWCRRRNAA